VFIGGAPRSGSTLLGVLAAEAGGAFNCGELAYLWPQLEGTGTCECGAPVARCPLWAAVAEDVRRALGGDFAEARSRLGRPRERWWDKARLPHPDPIDVAFRAATEEAVERVTGARRVLDASKRPDVLATALGRRRRAVVLHLVRDPRGVVFSTRSAKPLPRSSARALPPLPVWWVSAKWVRDNWWIEVLARRGAGEGVRYLRLSYEDLVAEPEGTLERVATAIGPAPASDGVPRGHGVAGNTALYAQAPVVADERWRQQLSRRDRALTVALAGPAMVRYGYSVLRPTADPT
jgi:hypothetical protein